MKENKPFVSIIVPIYNVEKYLRQCLDSIVKQTLENIEIILINDGSTDSCGKICDEYALKDKRIKVVHKKNAGLGAAYNTGLDLATGEYIGFVESDDWIESDMYEELYKKAKENQVDVCLSGFFYYTDSSNAPYQPFLNLRIFNAIYSIKDFTKLMTFHSSIWSRIYKRETLGHIRFPEFNNSGYYCDFPYWVEIVCCAKRMVNIPFCFYHYRIDNPDASSTNSRTDSKLLTVIDSSEETKNILKKYGKYDLLKEEMYYNCILTSFRFFANIDKEYKKEFFQRLREFVEDLRNDCNFIFKYFTEDNLLNLYRREFIFSLLNNDYKKAIELSFFIKYSAENIFKSQLSYQIGYILTHKVKSLKNIIQLPFLIFKAKKVFKERQKELKNINLPRLDQYPDYNKVLKMKNHLSYKIGKAIVDAHKKWYLGGYLILPFKILKIYLKHNYNFQFFHFQNNVNGQVLSKLDKLEAKLNKVERDVLNLKTNIQASQIHLDIFKKYKNFFKDKDIVIVGTGSSTKLYKKPKKAIHIGLNRSYKLNIKLDFLFINDAVYPENDFELRRFIENNPDCKVFLGLLPDRFLYNQTHFRHNPDLFCYSNVFPYVLEYFSQGVWAYDISHEPFGDFNSVVFSALQFACYANPQKIFLVGCDCVEGHFYKDYYSEKFSLSYLVPVWKKIKLLLDKFYPQIQIVSINPIGLKGLFDDIYEKEE